MQIQDLFPWKETERDFEKVVGIIYHYLCMLLIPFTLCIGYIFFAFFAVYVRFDGFYMFHKVYLSFVNINLTLFGSYLFLTQYVNNYSSYYESKTIISPKILDLLYKYKILIFLVTILSLGTFAQYDSFTIYNMSEYIIFLKSLVNFKFGLISSILSAIYIGLMIACEFGFDSQYYKREYAEYLLFILVLFISIYLVFVPLEAGIIIFFTSITAEIILRITKLWL